MSDERKTPLVATVFLLIGFVAILVVSVVTVLLPELEDDPDEVVDGGVRTAADAGT